MFKRFIQMRFSEKPSNNQKKNLDKKIRILGVDPGSRVSGYALVDLNRNKLDLIDYGSVKLPAKVDGEKLEKLFEFLTMIINKFKPDMLALEKVFIGKNAVSAIKLGQVRGVILLTCQRLEVEQFDYSPNEIKKALTGIGHASKEQIQFMAKQIFKLKKTPEVDAADAIAVAVCHANNYTYKKLMLSAEK